MNFPLESVQELPDDARGALAAALEHMQVRDRYAMRGGQTAAFMCQHHQRDRSSSHPCLQCSLRMYNNLVERCFKECAQDMRSKALNGQEEQVRGGWDWAVQHEWSAAICRQHQALCAMCVGARGGSLKRRGLAVLLSPMRVVASPGVPCPPPSGCSCHCHSVLICVCAGEGGICPRGREGSSSAPAFPFSSPCVVLAWEHAPHDAACVPHPHPPHARAPAPDKLRCAALPASQCVAKCAEKFMNTTARVGLRFQEFFTEMEKHAAASQQGEKK